DLADGALVELHLLQVRDHALDLAQVGLGPVRVGLGVLEVVGRGLLDLLQPLDMLRGVGHLAGLVALAVAAGAAGHGPVGVVGHVGLLIGGGRPGGGVGGVCAVLGVPAGEAAADLAGHLGEVGVVRASVGCGLNVGVGL